MKPVEVEQVDIEQEASRAPIYGDGELERLDGRYKVMFRWHKARIILWLSVLTIAAVLLASMLSLALSTDETTRDWSRQILTTLVGFAAGAIWTSAQRTDKDE
ncbi:hypothetical protein GU927_002540 [Rhodobacteraceae bacterium HSP-20]|uniref:Uncharacterized protein n=1 Tax=Paragemmobacter amnigenus TaxID=2852097 RepID=A0ABS6IYX6_9RHOB|nr:hypothetical protein [Rhodobacter amnigenus]MBU9696716.1 hypothetical protein [Rhodobacter amnigenus]MBV4387943.1 hypothetical protein [Rhodobacter amnigenus]